MDAPIHTWLSSAFWRLSKLCAASHRALEVDSKDKRGGIQCRNVVKQLSDTTLYPPRVFLGLQIGMVCEGHDHLELEFATQLFCHRLSH